MLVLFFALCGGGVPSIYEIVNKPSSLLPTPTQSCNQLQERERHTNRKEPRGNSYISRNHKA